VIHTCFRYLRNIEDKPCSKHGFYNTHDSCPYVCIRPPSRNYLWRQSAVRCAIYENNNISTGPWPTPMQCHDLSHSIDDRYMTMLLVQSINFLKRFRFVIINRLNRIYVLKNARGILQPTLFITKNVFKKQLFVF